MEQAAGIVYVLGLVAALWGAALALGLRRDRQELVEPLRRRGVLAGIVIADTVLVPLLAWTIVGLLDLDADAATGLLLVAIASAGPLGLKVSQLARLDDRAALCFVVVLDLANLVVMPFWAVVLLPEGTTLRPVEVLATLVVAILLPLGLGLLARPRVAERAPTLARRLEQASTLGLLAAIAATIAGEREALADAASASVVVATLAILVGAFALGWALGGRSPRTRGAAAFVTACRANALALAIAETSFPGLDAVHGTVVVFAIITIVLTTLAAAAVGRRFDARDDLAPARGRA
jgi:bile acid:Na+ symporter, BASS family